MHINTRRRYLIMLAVLAVLLAAAYLPKVHRVGFLQDDWNVLFVTEQIGPGSLIFHYSIDRPLQGYLTLFEYHLLNTNMTGYMIAALLSRFLDAVIIFLIMDLLWPKKWGVNLFIAGLALIYPAFHEQPHAFNYQTQFISRLCMVASIYLSLLPFYIKKNWLKVILVLLALTLAQTGYGLIDYHIGMEVLRIGLIGGVFILRRKTLKLWKIAAYCFPYLLGMAGFAYWRLFLFESKRASVNASNMLSAYSSLGAKLLGDLELLIKNTYRLVVSAFYKPLLVFGKYVETEDLLVGILLSLGVAIFFIIMISTGTKENDTTDEQEGMKYGPILIIIGLIGSIGALIPIIFGGREINYSLIGDRFSYPGSISACLLLGGIIDLIRKQWVKVAIMSLLISVSILTQYANDEIFARNGDQTRETWWQMSWRAPQLKPDTLLTGNIFLGILDEDYTLWGPANLIYYPGNHDVVITAEVLNEQTQVKMLEPQVVESERKGIEFIKNYNYLLVISKLENSCLHLIDGQHPEFSAADSENIRKVGVLSDISRIDAASGYEPSPRVDLFGKEPAQGWCYFYQKAQLERQKRDWSAAAEYGRTALREKYSPADPMEWLVFLQAFAYTNDPLYEQVEVKVLEDVYTSGQACGVFSTYSAEVAGTASAEGNSRLIQKFCK